MLEAGEDARFIARRLVILASEDVGMADPMALRGGRRRGPGRRVRRAARGPAQPGPGRRPPGHGAEVATARRWRSGTPGRTCARASAARCRRTCATPTTRARRSSATARATSTLTTTRGAGSPQRLPAGRRRRPPLLRALAATGTRQEVRRRHGRAARKPRTGRDRRRARACVLTTVLCVARASSAWRWC